MKILVTGANGFVGRVLVAELHGRRDQVIAVTREPASFADGVQNILLKDLLDAPKLHLKDVDSVIHLAGRAHQGKVAAEKLHEEAFRTRQSNLELTRQLATLTFEHSRARFVFLSSIGVYGRRTPMTTPVNEQSVVAPETIYAQTKLEAEYVLAQLSLAWGREYAVVRAPLIYGPNAPANFGALARLAATDWPLPLANADSPRAMIGVRNLAAFLRTVAVHPQASRRTFVISDTPLPSTRHIVELLRSSKGQPSRLIALPRSLVRLASRLIGREEAYHQLFSPYFVDSSLADRLLSWHPRYAPEENLVESAEDRKDNDSLTSDPSATISINRSSYLELRYALERVVAIILLIVGSPVLLAISVLVRSTSQGPALFIQERAGQGHRPFKIYKFRTMRIGTPNISTEEMQRSGLNPITPIGAFLRRTSLDELPQLINVLKGEMSFIGPRPALLTQETVLRLREQGGVQVIKPGITGYSQVTGRDDLSDQEKVLRDTLYLKELSVVMDLKILIKTFFSVFKGTGNK